jgi:NADH-quinone oxidoreductase subunit L
MEMTLQFITGILSVVGIYLAYLLFLRLHGKLEGRPRTAWGLAIRRFWFSGGGFDWLYDHLLVIPFVRLARINKGDVIDLFYRGIALFNKILYHLLSESQFGQVRWYAMVIILGAVITIAIAVFL